MPWWPLDDLWQNMTWWMTWHGYHFWHDFFFKGSCRDAPILKSKPPGHQFLQGDVSLELKVVSELQCWDYCMRQMDCKAYNYQHAIGQSLKTCQLLSNDVGLPVFRQDYTYHIIHKKNNSKNIKVSSVVKCMQLLRVRFSWRFHDDFLPWQPRICL